MVIKKIIFFFPVRGARAQGQGHGGPAGLPTRIREPGADRRPPQLLPLRAQEVRNVISRTQIEVQILFKTRTDFVQ